jgi:transcriptional regulator with XRE-family HTH domain
MFGEYARARREAKGIGLRDLAKSLGKSPTLISRVELGHEESVGEETLVAWAKALGEDPDLFLARAGKLQTDVREAIMGNPEVFIELIRRVRAMPKKRQAEVVKKVRDGDW